MARAPSVDPGLNSNNLQTLIIAANQGSGLRSFPLTEQEIIGECGHSRLNPSGLDTEGSQQIEQAREVLLRNGEEIEADLVALSSAGEIVVEDIFAPKRELAFDFLFQNLTQIRLGCLGEEDLLDDRLLLRHADEYRVPSGVEVRQKRKDRLP